MEGGLPAVLGPRERASAGDAEVAGGGTGQGAEAKTRGASPSVGGEGVLVGVGCMGGGGGGWGGGGGAGDGGGGVREGAEGAAVALSAGAAGGDRVRPRLLRVLAVAERERALAGVADPTPLAGCCCWSCCCCRCLAAFLCIKRQGLEENTKGRSENRRLRSTKGRHDFGGQPPGGGFSGVQGRAIDAQRFSQLEQAKRRSDLFFGAAATTSPHGSAGPPAPRPEPVDDATWAGGGEISATLPMGCSAEPDGARATVAAAGCWRTGRRGRRAWRSSSAPGGSWPCSTSLPTHWAP